MRVCVLEICPSEPISSHKQLFSSEAFDYFFVTYTSPNPDAIAFNKGKNWAFNRNTLYQHVKGKYDYYFFIDYDIELEAKSGSNPMSEMLRFLEDHRPVMYRPSGFRGELQLDSGYNIGGFINHSVTVLRNDAAEIIFDIPDKHGGFWDGASYINTLALPLFEDGIIVDYNIIAHNTESSGYLQNKIPFLGKRAMSKLFKEMKPFLPQEIQRFKSVDEMKSYYMNRRIETQNPPMGSSEIDASSMDLAGLKKFFQLN